MQLFIAGNHIGDGQVVMEMNEKGELQRLVEDYKQVRQSSGMIIGYKEISFQSEWEELRVWAVQRTAVCTLPVVPRQQKRNQKHVQRPKVYSMQPERIATLSRM